METIKKNRLEEKNVKIVQLHRYKQCMLMMTKRISDMCFYLPSLNSVLMQLGQWVRYGNNGQFMLHSLQCTNI